MARSEADDSGLWLLDLPPTAWHTWSAIGVGAGLSVGFAALIPFAGRPLAQLNAFFPSLDAIVLISDLITAALLFAQFSISRSRALLALASGYLFTALIVIPHALTFAGAFSPSGLIGANIQTGSWLYIFWHAGFAAALLVYAALRRQARAIPAPEGSTDRAIGWNVVVVCCVVCGLTWLSTAGATLLPPIVLDNSRISPLVIYPIGFTILTFAMSLVVLAVPRRSVLDQWLMVVALVSIWELVFSGVLPSVRFSLGFYSGRVLALAASSIVLIVLLAETTWLYARLAHSNAMLQREQHNKLMNMEALAGSISHEIRQPLAAMTANSETAMLLIRREPPERDEALAALDDAVQEGQRASQMLAGIRALFGKTARGHEPIDVNEAALGALRVLRHELNEHGVIVRTELASELPQVVGHRVQLQEVIINLVHNAIEAMGSVTNGRRALAVRTDLDGGNAIVVEVEDSGPGIAPDNIDKVFDAFVTTKPTGMGLGLAICRMIIERHGGRLSVAQARPHGAIFRMVLPQTR